jgi:hypothetical protein
LPPADRAEGDRLADLAGKIAAKEVIIRQLQEAINTAPDIKSLLATMVAQEREKMALVEEYEALKRQLATPVVDGMAQVHTLVDLLARDDSEEMRGRLRAKIAAVVESIKVWFTVPEGMTYGPRPMRVRIDFKRAPFAVIIEAEYRPGRYKHPEKLTVNMVEDEKYGVRMQRAKSRTLVDALAGS